MKTTSYFSLFILFLGMLLTGCESVIVDSPIGGGSSNEVFQVKEIIVHAFPERRPKDDKPWDPEFNGDRRHPDMYGHFLFKDQPVKGQCVEGGDTTKECGKTEKFTNATITETFGPIHLPFKKGVVKLNTDGRLGTYEVKIVDDDDGAFDSNDEMVSLTFRPQKGSTRIKSGDWDIEVVYF